MNVEDPSSCPACGAIIERPPGREWPNYCAQCGIRLAPLEPASTGRQALDDLLTCLAEDSGVPVPVYLDALTAAVVTRAITATADDLEIDPEIARTLIIRWAERTARTGRPG